MNPEMRFNAIHVKIIFAARVLELGIFAVEDRELELR
jgi:hypothetical protein